MIKRTETEGPSVAEALDAALEEMGVQQDMVEYEVLAEPGRRMFGIKSDKAARVAVWLKPEAERSLETIEAEEPEDEARPTEWVEKEPEEFTDEELDAIADTAVKVVNDVVRCYGLEPSVEEYEGDEGEIILDIVGDDLGILIGRHGKTLDALQVIVSAITNRRIERRHPVLVDVSGYRHRRRMKVEEIARRAAERASRQSRPVELRPMTSFERKVVHMALRDDRRVSTASDGVEPFRHVVVSPQ
ncbi:MAG: RNA-binding cell elongation regulator Jag/EloR [Coriobacteriia bacterium]|nr:RNA-binding cell elongation regulator Jag/EloR [Coriobacteriia bacterium]